MRFLKTLGLMTLTSLLFSCGSGGSSSNISSGFLSAAPVDNANCSIYKITSEGVKGDKLTSKISKKGVVAFSNIGYSGKALIECSAGDYTDEATNDEKQSPMLRAALNFTEGEKFAITPLTEIAVQIDTDLNKVIDTHNNTVANAFGLSGKSITLILPTDIDKIDVDDDDAGDYAMILAMLSKFESQGASESNSLSKVIDLLKIDLTDKTLDRMTVEKLIMALNALESKFKNVNADRIKANMIGNPLLTNLLTKNLISGNAATFTFDNIGGDAGNCGVEPNLPSGLTIALIKGSCKISGTPVALQDTITYTVKATNLKGDSTATVSIRVDLDTPKNLVATIGDGTIALAWSAVSGATGYKIYYAQNEISASNLGSALLMQASNASGIVNNLTNSTKYYFVVTAVKEDVESSLSAAISATPVLSKPSITNLSAKHLILHDSITAFVFNNTGGAISSCSATSLPNGLSIMLTNGSCQISGTPTTLQNATTYTIQATNASGDSSATISISVGLGVPRNLTATKGDTAVDLTWSAVNGAIGYKIYYAQNEISASNLGSALSVQASSVSRTVNNLTNDTKYYFVVTAVKGDAESALSAMVSATPILSKPALANLSVKHLILNASIEVFAFINTGGLASSCNSEPSLPSGLTITLVGGSCQISGTPTVLQDATTYTIKATNSAGDSTATISISIDSITPENLTSARSNGAVFLAWNAISGATKYQVYYAMQSFNGISDLSNYASLNGGSLLQNITSNSKFITNLTNGTKYYFVVTTTKDAVESDKSNEVTATPLIGVLNDTGITQGGNYESGNNDTCTGEKIAAQDCSHGRDGKAVAGTLAKVGGGMAGFDFTKLGSTGNVLSIQNATWEADDTGDTGTESAGTKWSCVKDNHTGLVWEVKTGSNKSTLYAWGGKTALGRNHANKQGAYNDDWTSLVDSKNAGNGYCGFTNWKVPTIVELGSIVHQGMVNPKIDNHYFPNTSTVTTLSVWSSSPKADNHDLAWQLRFSAGFNHGYNRNSKGYVRLVRSGQ